MGSIKKIAIVGIAFACFIGGGIYIVRQFREPSEENDSKEKVAIQRVDSIARDGNLEEERAKIKRQNEWTNLLSKISNLKAHQAPEDESRLTDEEKVYRDEVVKKTDEFYFELAPRVLEEMLQEEKGDDAWRSDVVKKIDTLINDDRLAGTELELVDCRDTLCKTQVNLPSDKQLPDFKALWSTRGPTMGADFGEPQTLEDGTTAVTIYFTRKGGSDPMWKMRERMIPIIDQRNSN